MINMKKLILLAIIPFLFFIGLVNAIAMTSCDTINTAGIYRFNQNITTNTTYCNVNATCLTINSSSVTLNLNGYSLIDDGGCQYGIYVNARDSDPTIVFNDIQIYGGNIISFNNAGIRINGINLSSINNLKIINYGTGNGISLQQPFNSLEIYNNYIETGNYAIEASGYYGVNIHNNNLQSLNGLYLNGYGFIVKNNLFGNLSIISSTYNGNFFTNNFLYSNTSTECSLGLNPINNAINCDFCVNSNISNNIIVSQDGINVINDAENNRISQNQYYSGSIFSSIANFDSTTIDNVFCSNTITTFDLGGFDATNNICYWRGTSIDAKPFVVDLNSNSILDNCINNCIPMTSCNGTNKVTINSTCGITSIYSCEFGCINGVCGGFSTLVYPISTTTTTTPISSWNVSLLTPVINQTDFQEAGMTFLTPFFTPLFLIIIIYVLISSVLASMTKQIITFPIIFLTLTLVLGYMGIFTAWITAVLAIFSSLAIALILKTMVKG